MTRPVYERCLRHDCQREETCKQALCPVKIEDQRKAKEK